MTAPQPVFGVGGSPASGTGALPVQLTAGESHTCAVILTGQAFCWGENQKGQVGDGTPAERPSPTLVVGLTSGIQAITAGVASGCAVEANLSLRCWGSVDGNDLTAHPTAQPVTALSSGVGPVSAGEESACALVASGSLKCWGQNTFGELGTGTTVASPTPVTVPGLLGKVGRVDQGDAATCSTDAKTSTMWCWGYDVYGQLGNGASATDFDTPQEVTTTLGLDVSTAFGHSCAISTNGKSYCWGANDYGELGNGTTTGTDNPVKVKGLAAPAVQIAAGGVFDPSNIPDDFSCALEVTGEVQCWGNDSQGQLGDSSTANSPSPVKVNLSGPAKAVVAGANGACALLATGTVQCWGADSLGELGDGGSADQTTPVTVPGVSGVLEISSDDAVSTCVLNASNAVLCWGDNSLDELGDGSSGGLANTAQPVQGL